MMLQDKYKNESQQLLKFKPFAEKKEVSWLSPSNIALIKYWGKKHFQIPQNPSLSFTLKNAFTKTKIAYKYKSEAGISFDFFFEGNENVAFKTRIEKYLMVLQEYFPFLNNLHLTIHSENSFPHSSGIASSASAMSALALCVCSIEKELFNTLSDTNEFYRKASFLSRLGSGSAARSVYGGFTVWGESKSMNKSTNEAAVQFKKQIHESFQQLEDAILITSDKKKSVSSTAGHGLMDSHPYAEVRYNQAQGNLNELLNTLKSGDKKSFIRIVENEALSLHALMMSSEPGFTLLNENTWNIINAIRKFRQETDTFITFTLDAGPNVHVIYAKKDREIVSGFIKNNLLQFCQNKRWIDDELGEGPVQL
jgi:diphosphomevalonate decarboxylase